MDPGGDLEFRNRRNFGDARDRPWSDSIFTKEATYSLCRLDVVALRYRGGLWCFHFDVGFQRPPVDGAMELVIGRRLGRGNAPGIHGRPHRRVALSSAGCCGVGRVTGGSTDQGNRVSLDSGRAVLCRTRLRVLAGWGFRITTAVS